MPVQAEHGHPEGEGLARPPLTVPARRLSARGQLLAICHRIRRINELLEPIVPRLVREYEVILRELEDISRAL